MDSMETDHPDCLKMRESLIRNDYQGIIDSLGNSLEAPAVRLVSQINDAKKELKEAGFDGVLMSGSGSTVFGITKDKELVEKTMEKLKKQRYFVRHTNILV